MKIFGIELKFNGFDIWHSGNFNPDSKANVTDIPTSLPANGGNAEQVGGYSAWNLMKVVRQLNQYEDFDNVVEPGIYHVGDISGMAHRPPNSTPTQDMSWSLLEVYMTSNAYVVQKITQVINGNFSYYRVRTENYWDVWRKFVTEDELLNYDYTKYKEITVQGDPDTYYPVVFTGINDWDAKICIKKYVHDYAQWDGWLRFEIDVASPTWGGSGQYSIPKVFMESNNHFVGDFHWTNNSGAGFVVWLRGGGRTYSYYCNRLQADGYVNVYYSSTNIVSDQTYPEIVEPIYGVAQDLNNNFWVGKTDYLIKGNTPWHSGNDGPGSGLDSDTVDGFQVYDLMKINYQLGSNTDLNSMIEPGMYLVGDISNMANRPPNDNMSWSLLIVYRTLSGYTAQELRNVSSSRVYFRCFDGGSNWTSWDKVITKSEDTFFHTKGYDFFGDFSTLTSVGMYSISGFGGSSNYPSGAYQYGTLLVFHGRDENNVHGLNQMYLAHQNAEIWIRGCWDAVSANWTTWAKLANLSDIPTKLSQFENDIGAGTGINIVASATEPVSLNTGDWWYKEI